MSSLFIAYRVATLTSEMPRKLRASGVEVLARRPGVEELAMTKAPVVAMAAAATALGTVLGSLALRLRAGL